MSTLVFSIPTSLFLSITIISDKGLVVKDFFQVFETFFSGLIAFPLSYNLLYHKIFQKSIGRFAQDYGKIFVQNFFQKSLDKSARSVV